MYKQSQANRVDVGAHIAVDHTYTVKGRRVIDAERSYDSTCDHGASWLSLSLHRAHVTQGCSWLPQVSHHACLTTSVPVVISCGYRVQYHGRAFTGVPSVAPHNQITR